jgi:hypothetical protein
LVYWVISQIAGEKPVQLINPCNESTFQSSGRLIFGQFERIGTELFYFGGKFCGVLGKSGAFAGRQVKHPGPLAADTDGIQDLLGLFDPPTGHQIAGVIMALAFQTPDNAGTVCAFFNGPQHMNHINLAGAWNANDFDVRRVLQSHRTCQVRCRVASEIAAKRNNDRLKIFAHSFPLKNEY